MRGFRLHAEFIEEFEIFVGDFFTHSAPPWPCVADRRRPRPFAFPMGPSL
jgi:hypothetical protein